MVLFVTQLVELLQMSAAKQTSLAKHLNCPKKRDPDPLCLSDIASGRSLWKRSVPSPAMICILSFFKDSCSILLFVMAHGRELYMRKRH